MYCIHKDYSTSIHPLYTGSGQSTTLDTSGPEQYGGWRESNSLDAGTILTCQQPLSDQLSTEYTRTTGVVYTPHSDRMTEGPS